MRTKRWKTRLTPVILMLLLFSGAFILTLIFLSRVGITTPPGRIDSKLFDYASHKDDVMGSEYRRERIKTIQFRDTTDGRSIDAWDISAKQDGSVMAWVTAADNELYDLTIAGNGVRCSVDSCENLFDGYSEVTDIALNGCLDTGAVKNMEWMFAHCSQLRHIDLRGMDTSSAELMNCMFYDCTSLQALDVGSFDTSKVQKMYGMFHLCESLSQLDVSGFNTLAVTEMDGMFDGCSRLQALDVSGFDTSKVTDMSGMFAGCESITYLDISGFDTSNVTDMSGMFSHCLNLETLNTGKLDLAKVEDMGYMFENCIKLSDLDRTAFDNAKANKEEMFAGTVFE